MRKPIRYVLRSWHALAAPAKTLKPVVERLNLALVATINSAEVKKKLAELNGDLSPAPRRRRRSCWPWRSGIGLR